MRDFGLEMEARQDPPEPNLWITHAGFERATGIDLRTPVHEELIDRVKQGLEKLDNDFPAWFAGVVGERDDGLVLRFRDAEAMNNVVSTLRNRGLNDR